MGLRCHSISETRSEPGLLRNSDFADRGKSMPPRRSWTGGVPKREILIQDQLAICFVFLSMLFLHPTAANPLPADDSSLKVSELPFSEKLRNPCALVDASRLQRATISQSDRASTGRMVINEMKAKALLLRDSAETILDTNVLQDCSSLELPSVAIIPSTDDLSDSRPLEVLRLFYTSLLNHTAHVYFISEQLQRHSSDNTCNSPELFGSVRTLASNMRELMCVLRLSTLTLERDDERDAHSFDDSTDQILNEQLTDQPLCSRRTVRDCQTVGSTVTLLRRLSSYLQSTALVNESESP